MTPTPGHTPHEAAEAEAAEEVSEGVHGREAAEAAAGAEVVEGIEAHERVEDKAERDVAKRLGDDDDDAEPEPAA